MEQKKEHKNWPPKYRQLIFGKGEKVIQWSKDSLFNQSVLELDILMQKNKSRHRLNTLHKNLFKIDHKPKFKTQNYKTPKR